VDVMLSVSDLEQNLDVVSLLEHWGFDTCDMRQVSSNEWRSACFLHMGDNSTSLSVRLHNGRWYVYCYSHGCFNGTLVDLGLSRGRTFRDILSDYAVCQGEPTKRPTRKCARDTCDANATLPSDVMERYEPSIHRNLIELGYSRNILRDVFDVRFCCDPNDPMYGRIVYAIRTRTGDIVSIQGRRTRACGDGAAKYMFLGGYSAKHHVYGVWEWRDRLKRVPYVVVAESPKSTWRGYQLNIPTLATMGVRFTPQQVKVIASIGKPVVCIADNDEHNVGWNGMRELAYALKQYVPVRLGMAPNVGCDIADYRARDEWIRIIQRCGVI
jgi:hypothetical protein